MAKDDSRCVGVLLEEIREGFKTIHELVTDVPKRQESNELKQDVSEIKQDIRVIKAAVTVTSRDVVDLDRRVTRLEGLETA